MSTPNSTDDDADRLWSARNTLAVVHTSIKMLEAQQAAATENAEHIALAAALGAYRHVRELLLKPAPPQMKETP